MIEDKLLTEIIGNQLSMYDSLSVSTKALLNAAIIDSVVNGGLKDDLINAIRNILTGSGSVTATGRPMSAYASTLTQDSLMEYYANANLLASEEAGIDKFEYAGTLIKDSRDWCISHQDKQYTKEEIAGFDGDSWAGKKSGSTMIHRGGYNCRHWWIPIID